MDNDHRKTFKRWAITLALVLALVLTLVLVAVLGYKESDVEESNVGNGTADNETDLCATNKDTFKEPSYCNDTSERKFPSPMCEVEKALLRSECPSRHAMINCPMAIFGLLLVLHYHVVPFIVYYSGGELQKSLIRIFGRTYKYNFARLLGRNIIILNVYHNKHTNKYSPIEDNPFVASLLFVFVDAFLLHRICRFLQHKEEKKFGITEDFKEGRVVQSQFSDFSIRFGFASAVFVCQISLFMLFVLQMNDDAESRQISSFKFLHWLIAVLVTNVAGNEECGATFQWGVWRELWKIDIRHQTEQDDNAPVFHMADHKTEWRFRLVYDVIINGFFREVLLSIAPVALSSSKRDDFIKDCLAIFFIAKMDDISEPKTIEECLKSWQAQERELQAVSQSMQATSSTNLGIASSWSRLPSSWSRLPSCCSPKAAADVEEQGETVDPRREGESDLQQPLVKEPAEAEAEPPEQDQKPTPSLEERLQLSLKEAPKSTGALLEALVGEVRELRELKLKAA